MRIVGIVLAAAYAGIMIFAVSREKTKSVSSAVIAGGGVLMIVYSLINALLDRNLIAVLIIGMGAVSLGALMNGIRQKAVHVSHHVMRLVVEVVIAGICWIGG